MIVSFNFGHDPLVSGVDSGLAAVVFSRAPPVGLVAWGILFPYHVRVALAVKEDGVTPLGRAVVGYFPHLPFAVNHHHPSF